MKDLPPALLTPPNDRYPLDDAIRVWLHIYHGWAYDTPGHAKDRDYQRCHLLALRELRGIVQTTPHASTFLGHAGQSPFPGRIRAHWVSRADLEQLALARGTALQSVSEPTRPRSRTTRDDRLNLAIKTAREALRATLKREPKASEVMTYLENDPTETVVDYTDATLTWADASGKLHDTSRKSIANRLSRLHKQS